VVYIIKSKIICSLLAATTMLSCASLVANADAIPDGVISAKKLPETSGITSDYPMGDVDRNHYVDASDALLTLRASVRLESLDEYQVQLGDLDGDNNIDSADSLAILHLSLKTEAPKPVVQDTSLQKFETPSKGVDVSFWQEDIDFNKLKANGVDFVIIRAGRGITGRTNRGVDEYFEVNYKKAKAAGLKVGVYWYSYAMSTDEAYQEAQCCLDALKGKQLDYPVFYDVEEERQLNSGKDYCSAIMDIFCSEVKNAGYYPGFYMSAWFAKNVLNDDVKSKYDCWIAQWGNAVTFDVDYTMWQYGVGRIGGVNGDVDVDISYYDYPSYMKMNHVNGY
jgi:GH25 family lysozyme M1 (1,4-beta-N-acetylmuramidase)